MKESAELLNSLGNVLTATLWPAVLLIVFFNLRGEIRGMISRIKSVKAFGAEAEFIEMQISRLRHEVAPSGEEHAYERETHARSIEGEMGAKRGARIDWKDREVLLEAMKNPLAAIGQLASDLRSAVFQLAETHAINVYKVGAPHPQVMATVGRLGEAGVIDDAFTRRLYSFLDLSNAVTLGHKVSQEAYGELIESGIVLYEHIQDLLKTAGVAAEPKT